MLRMVSLCQPMMHVGCCLGRYTWLPWEPLSAEYWGGTMYTTGAVQQIAGISRALRQLRLSSTAL